MSSDKFFHDSECISAYFSIIAKIFPDLLLNDQTWLWQTGLVPGQCDQLSIIGHIDWGLRYNSGQINVVFNMFLMLKLQRIAVHLLAHCHRGTCGHDVSLIEGSSSSVMHYIIGGYSCRMENLRAREERSFINWTLILLLWPFYWAMGGFALGAALFIAPSK